MLAASRGDEAQALYRGRVARRRPNAARARGSALVLWLNALRHNGHGRYAEALDATRRRACEHEDVMAYGWALVELIEAGVRVGRPDAAAAALERLSERTRASGTEWALGIEARCRALVSDDESLYRESIERLARSRAAVELARSRLLYGEWLRRENRRTDARELLRAAHESFSRMGPPRSPSAPAASCSPPARPCAGSPPDTRDDLTPQEVQVARLARDGHTNPEIGAQLFISPRTVEYHLHKVFRKLDVSTRKELRDALARHSPRRRRGHREQVDDTDLRQPVRPAAVAAPSRHPAAAAERLGRRHGERRRRRRVSGGRDHQRRRGRRARI